MRRIIAVILGVGVLAWLATGVVVVSPGEVVVVRRLGRVLARPWTQGLHCALPVGVDRRERIRTDRVRQLAVGLAGVAGAGDAPGAGEFVTGDLNLVQARAVVQYRVADPVRYTLRCVDVERVLPRLAESSLCAALARRGIDDALREGRLEVARDAAAELGRRAAQAELGIAVLSINLTEARPPTEVQADFDAAQAAGSDRTRRVTEGQTYAKTTAAAAEAEAQARVDRAHAAARRGVALAQARSERFLRLLAEAQRNRPLTVRRLYLDALRELMPGLKRKLVLTPEGPVDLSVLGVDGGQ